MVPNGKKNLSFYKKQFVKQQFCKQQFYKQQFINNSFRSNGLGQESTEWFRAAPLCNQVLNIAEMEKKTSFYKQQFLK